MTFQPPPPPPGDNPPPPPPPPGQWGPPPGGGYPQQRPGFDPKTVNPLDWAILGVAFLIFIFSFTDYLTAPFGFGWNAWHFSHWTFLTWFAMVFGVIAGAVVAVDLFAPQMRMQWSNRVVGLMLFAASFVLYFIAIFVHTDFAGVISHGFGFWISLILAALGTVVSLMRAQQTGTQLPGALANLPNIGARGPQGGIGGGPTPPPPPGYGPPAQ